MKLMMGNRYKFKFVNVSSYTIMTHKVINQRDVQITTLIVTSYDHFDLYVFDLELLLQCWENCELLQSNYQVWGAVCDEKDICVSI